MFLVFGILFCYKFLISFVFGSTANILFARTEIEFLTKIRSRGGVQNAKSKFIVNKIDCNEWQVLGIQSGNGIFVLTKKVNFKLLSGKE